MRYRKYAFECLKMAANCERKGRRTEANEWRRISADWFRQAAPMMHLNP